MDTVKKLIITAVMLMCSLSVYAQSAAGREIANIQSWLNEGSQGYYKPGTGDQWVRNSANGDRFVKVESTIDYKASNGRNYPVVIEKTGQIDGSKIGKAVVKMAKFLPPLALGFEVYDLICDLSSICKKSDADEFEYRNAVTDYDKVKNLEGWVENGQLKPGSLESILQEKGCSVTFNCITSIDTLTATQLVVKTELRRLSDNASLGTTYFNKSPFAEPEDITGDGRPIAESDWTAAETQLNDERFDEPLLVNGQPVPLANLPIFGNVPPITISDTETINRDSQGNVTGTTRTTTTLEVTDSATTERPGSVTGTETTVKTDYNTSGQPTGTQTSINTPPPPDKPQEPPTISFDNAEGLPIETEVVNLQLPAAVSWGEGTCPADVPLPFNNLSIPYQPACDAAMQLRPVVIFLASISALLIVSGLRESKS